MCVQPCEKFSIPLCPGQESTEGEIERPANSGRAAEEGRQLHLPAAKLQGKKKTLTLNLILNYLVQFDHWFE